MERPSGPLGAATLSSRSLSSMGNPRPEYLNAGRRIPIPSNELAPPPTVAIPQPPITGAQFVSLAESCMKLALDEHIEKEKAARAGGFIPPGVTLDLSHKRIQMFPEEVVDILKEQLERLALSHNQITTFPSRFSECTALRYLNVRNNSIREFPESFLELKSLEILDLAKNKLTSLPPQLYKLTSLKVLSVQRNRLETLPLCIADMTTLHVLKLGSNPLQFPPKKALRVPLQASLNGSNQGNDETGIDKANDMDIAVTTLVKRLLRESQKPASLRREPESGGDESSEGAETPRPMKRVISGRFPIKVNGSDMPDLRSPNFASRPPPIPSRSHQRGVSNQSTGRSGAQPLAISNSNERVRSNSESLAPTIDPREAREPSKDRFLAEKSRRNGIVSKKPLELDTVDEIKINNRYSHYRGLSHGSAMAGNTRVPASPADAPQRASYVKRLSSLPERKRESSSADPVVEAARSILYALSQVHPLIQILLSVARDGTNKRTSLERVFYNANTHVDEFEKHVQKYDAYTEEDEETAPLSNETVYSSCVTCVAAYIHVCHLLQNNVLALLNNGDPRYIRSLLLNVYGSIAEIRNASEAFSRAHHPGSTDHPNVIVEHGKATVNTQLRRIVLRNASISAESTLKPQFRERLWSQPDVLTSASRGRRGTVIQNANLRVATGPPTGPSPSQVIPPAERSAMFSTAFQNAFQNGVFNPNVSSAATPRSGESFASTTSSGRALGGDFTEEDKTFEQLFLTTQETTDLAIRSLPLVHTKFRVALQKNQASNRPEVNNSDFEQLIARTADSYRVAGELKTRLSEIKLKDPGVRTQPSFWRLYKAFINSFIELVTDVKRASRVTVLVGADTIEILRPLQKSIKTMTLQLNNSPWAYLAADTNHQANNSLQSPSTQIHMPMTPQSAALGPAVQATVPSTPLTASSFSTVSNNSSFDRSDTFTSANSSAMNSRSGTMTSFGSSTLVPSEGSITPSVMQNPAVSFPQRYGTGYRDGHTNGYSFSAYSNGGRPSF